MTTDYKMPPLRVNGRVPESRPEPPFPMPDDTLADTPPATAPVLAEQTRKGALAHAADWTRQLVAGESARAEKGRGFWGENPPSLSVLRQWIHTTRWYRSEVGALKVLAWIDGYLLVMPVTALLYIAAWIWQRPLRRLVALILGTIIYLYM